MKMEDIRLTVTTDTAGDGTATYTKSIYGMFYAVEAIDGDFADGVDATLTVTNTPSAVDQTLITLTDFNTDGWYYPRVVTHDNTGAALTYDSTESVTDLGIINGTPLLTIAQGGDTKTGGLILHVITFN